MCLDDSRLINALSKFAAWFSGEERGPKAKWATARFRHRPPAHPQPLVNVPLRATESRRRRVRTRRPRVLQRVLVVQCTPCRIRRRPRRVRRIRRIVRRRRRVIRRHRRVVRRVLRVVRPRQPYPRQHRRRRPCAQPQHPQRRRRRNVHIPALRRSRRTRHRCRLRRQRQRLPFRYLLFPPLPLHLQHPFLRRHHHRPVQHRHFPQRLVSRRWQHRHVPRLHPHLRARPRMVHGYIPATQLHRHRLRFPQKRRLRLPPKHHPVPLLQRHHRYAVPHPQMVPAENRRVRHQRLSAQRRVPAPSHRPDRRRPRQQRHQSNPYHRYQRQTQLQCLLPIEHLHSPLPFPRVARVNLSARTGKTH